MKYLIVEDFSGQPVPFIFPHRVTHADMREQLPYSKVIAAGYVQLKDGVFVCHGGDSDVNASARPGDAALLTASFAGSGTAVKTCLV